MKYGLMVAFKDENDNLLMEERGPFDTEHRAETEMYVSFGHDQYFSSHGRFFPSNRILSIIIGAVNDGENE